MPHTFAMLWKAGTGESIAPILLCHPGMGFDYHAKEFFECRYNLLYGGFDYCIFQQKAHPFAGSDEDMEAAKKLAGLAKDGGVTPVFALTWAEKAHPENQSKMNAFHQELCEATGSLLSPVGLIWENLLKTDREFPLFWADGEHASVYGDYLIACTHYRLLSGKSCLDLPSAGCDFFDRETKSIKNSAEACETELDPIICEKIRLAVEQQYSTSGLQSQ